MSTVNYVQFQACIHFAVKQHEELQNKTQKQQEGAYLGPELLIKINLKTPKVTNSTSNDMNFEWTWCYKIATKHRERHYAIAAHTKNIKE